MYMGEFDWIERDRGILTKRDRRFLKGELDEELTDNQKYQKRYQIRKRIRNSMFDFHILYSALSPRDINMLWEETDDWIYRAQRQRRRGDDSPYPRVPLLAHCWRDLIALFTYAQITTGTREAENLVQWIIEEGINKAVRRHTFDNYDMYREVDSALDWGMGPVHNLLDYLEHIGEQTPEDPDEAEEYLLELVRAGYLQRNHVSYIHEHYVDD